MKYFVILMIAGMGCFSIALTFLPLLPIRPQKFALMFSMGSLLTLAAMAMLKGPSEWIARCAALRQRRWCRRCRRLPCDAFCRVLVGSLSGRPSLDRSRIASDQLPVSAFYTVMLIGTVRRQPHCDAPACWHTRSAVTDRAVVLRTFAAVRRPDLELPVLGYVLGRAVLSTDLVPMRRRPGRPDAADDDRNDHDRCQRDDVPVHQAVQIK